MNIVLTGCYGFIGTNVGNHFKDHNIIMVDDYIFRDRYNINLPNIKSCSKLDVFKYEALTFAEADIVIHLGAITDTFETNVEELTKWNLNYSKDIWKYCIKHNTSLIYASSAATYGDGSNGFSDYTKPSELVPLNDYAISKNEFDKFVLESHETPPFWAGLKFFNVYGPFENHKGKMASVVWHGYNQIKETGKMNLFKGEHKRDFVYVQDICNVIEWLIQNKPKNDIYNLGSGIARNFKDLASNIFSSMNLEENINYIDIPEQIKNSYQSFTEADMSKLKSVGYTKEFYSLEEGVNNYITILNK